MTTHSSQFTADTLNYDGNSDNGLLALDVAKDLAVQYPALRVDFKGFFDKLDAHTEACNGGCHSTAFGVVADVKKMLNARDVLLLQCGYCGYSNDYRPCLGCGY